MHLTASHEDIYCVGGNERETKWINNDCFSVKATKHIFFFLGLQNTCKWNRQKQVLESCLINFRIVSLFAWVEKQKISSQRNFKLIVRTVECNIVTSLKCSKLLISFILAQFFIFHFCRHEQWKKENEKKWEFFCKKNKGVAKGQRVWRLRRYLWVRFLISFLSDS